MYFFLFLSTLLLLDSTTCFNDRLFAREPLERWSHSPENCGINFMPLKMRYYSCFKWLPIKEQKKRAAYDQIMASHPTGRKLQPPKDTSTGSNNRPSPRIVGGNDSVPGEFPWSVVVNRLIDNIWPIPNEWANLTCNGAFILSNFVMTAAHCLVQNNETLPASNVQIRYNSEARRYDDLYVEMAAGIFVHPDYNKIPGAPISLFDIALIRLERSVSFQLIYQRNYFRANALCLPDTDWSIGSNNEDVFWMSSFGPMDYSGVRPRVLQKFMVVPQEKWNSQYKLTYLETRYRFGYANCRGDSGAPLAYHNADGRFFIAGVHSTSDQAIGVCAQQGGTQAQVMHLTNLNWVKETIISEMNWS